MLAKTPIAVISGPVGVGKSSTADELSEIMENDEVPHTYIDLDHLRYT